MDNIDKLTMTEDDRFLLEYELETGKDDCKVDLTQEVDRPPICLSKGSKNYYTKYGMKEFPIPLATYGNFSFVQAPPKSFKTFFVSLLVGAYCGAGSEYVEDIKANRGGRHLLHFDTEQGKWHCQKVFMRVIDMIGTDIVPDYYHTFSLREKGFNHRRNYIEFQLEKLSEEGDKAGLVVIDGIADLVPDVNDLTYSNLIVQWLMEITTKYDCHVITIIHSNYGSEKPTGHLGSLLEKKAETQFKLDRTEGGEVKVSCRRTRNTPFKDFKFALNKQNLPQIF